MLPIWTRLKFCPPVNSMPNYKIFDESNLKALQMTINVTENKFFLGRVENIGKGQNAGYQHFLLFPH